MDRISELSNHILSDILTILSTEDLLKTSILSKRWHKLWTLCIDLYFDTSNVLGSNNEEEYAPTVKPGFHLTMKRHPIVILGKRQPIKLTMKRRVTLDDEFVKRVDRFVKNFQGTIIKSFMVNFCLDKEQRRSIDQWITFAIARQVQRIDLLFLGTPCANRTTGLHNCYKFNFALFSKTDASTLNHLRLENCSIFDTRGLDTDDFSPFKNLRSLSLEEVKLDGTYLGNMISSCPWLEQLCLFYFDTPMLKSIDFSISFKKGLGSFAFCATKFPKLEIMHVDIYSTVAAPKIIQPFKHLKELKLKLSLSWKILNDVEYDLLWILNILQASLLLQKLTVM
ncbi:F-box/FBD/LRR-repeat protein, partial [Trifolium pratense]